jgi:ribosomal protein L24E
MKETNFEISIKCKTCGETIEFNDGTGKMYVWITDDWGLVIKCNTCGTQSKC